MSTEQTPNQELVREEKSSETLSSSEESVSEKEEIFAEHIVYKRVKSIQFSILSPKLMKKMAAAKVVTPELYDKEGYLRTRHGIAIREAIAALRYA